MRHLRKIEVLTLAAALIAAAVLVERALTADRPIRVGVLHSLSGTMAISEQSLVDAVQLAIAEINQSGGVLGRNLQAVIADGKSDPDVFAAEAERLVRDEKVAVVFGCWTSGSRKTVRPVIEKYDSLMLYPLQYEGLETSKNIIYLGATPNQQIIPALKWIVGNVGRRVFLVGSDYVFPRAANAIIREQMKKWRGEIVGERYIVLGSRAVDQAVREIVATHPDAILNTLNGDTNVAFFTALRAAGVTSAKTPTLSFSIAEQELGSLPRQAMAGDYASWTYFQSLDTPVNDDFVRAFQRRYGEDRVTDDPIEAAYVAVKLWASAVEAAGSPAPAAVRKTIVDRAFRGPGGMVFVDAENGHTWKTVRIGKIRSDGQFDIVWSSDRPVRPTPFPATRTRDQWDAFLKQMYAGWGNRWYNPGSDGPSPAVKSVPYR